jgi:hypothetical protein
MLLGLGMHLLLRSSHRTALLESPSKLGPRQRASVYQVECVLLWRSDNRLAVSLRCERGIWGSAPNSSVRISAGLARRGSCGVLQTRASHCRPKPWSQRSSVFLSVCLARGVWRACDGPSLGQATWWVLARYRA